MERKSRVSKYQNLRDQLNADVIGSTVNPDVFVYTKGTPVKIEPAVSAEEVREDTAAAAEEVKKEAKDYVAEIESETDKIDEIVKQNQEVLDTAAKEQEVRLDDTLSFGIDLSDTIKLNLDDIQAEFEEPAKTEEVTKPAEEPVQAKDLNEILRFRDEPQFTTLSVEPEAKPKRFEATYEPLFSSDVFTMDEPEEAKVEEPEEASVETFEEPAAQEEPEVRNEEPVSAEDVLEESERLMEDAQNLNAETEELSEPETAELPQSEAEEPEEEPAAVPEETVADEEFDAADEREEDFTEDDFHPEELEQENDDLGVQIGDNFLSQTIDEAKRYSMSKGERSALDTTSAIIAELTQEPMPEPEESESLAAPENAPQIDDLTKRTDAESTEPEESMEFNADIDALLNGEPEEVEPADRKIITLDEPAPLEVNAPDPIPVEPAEEEPVIEEGPEEEPVNEPEPAEEEKPEYDDKKEAEDISSFLNHEAEEAIRDDDLDNNFFNEEPEEAPELLSASYVNEPAVEEEPEEEPDNTVMHSDPGDTIVVAPIKDQTQLINALTVKLEREHIMRADLEEQTKQMKMDIDELGADVNTVTKSVRKANKLLNFVLGLLIFILFALLAAFAYLALSGRGILGGESFNDITENVYMYLAGNYLL